MNDMDWDPKAIVAGLTPEAFPVDPVEPVKPKAEELDADYALIEKRYGLTPRAASTMALTQTSLFTGDELELLEMAARGFPSDNGLLFPLIHRYFTTPPKRTPK